MRVPVTRQLATFAAVLTLFAAGPAHAVSDEVRKYLNSATTMFENLQYEKALKQLQKAKPKSAGAEDDMVIALYEGVMLAELGKDDKATASFKTALSMDPHARLPFEVSPKVEKSFEKARVQVEKLLAPQLAREAEEKKRREEEEAKKAEEAKRAEDARRAEQERVARENAPPPPPLVEGQGAQKSGGARKFFWVPGVLGVGLAGGGAISLVLAKGNYDKLATGNTTPADAPSVRDTGKMQQTLGWVLVGAGGAAVAAALGMLIFGGGPADAPPPAQVALVPGPGGASVMLSGTLP